MFISFESLCLMAHTDITQRRAQVCLCPAFINLTTHPISLKSKINKYNLRIIYSYTIIITTYEEKEIEHYVGHKNNNLTTNYTPHLKINVVT